MKILLRFCLLVLLAALAACQFTPYERHLPEWVERVYIPMVRNMTYEPNLEAAVTRALEEKILSDGRLTLVSGKTDADAVIEVTLVTFSDLPSSFNSEDIGTRNRISLESRASLFEPYDLENAFAEVQNVITQVPYDSDYRRAETSVPADAYEDLAAVVADDLFQAIVNSPTLLQD